MQFEWDPAKNTLNLVNHGIDFPAAARIFAAPYVVIPTQYQSEVRSIAIGPIEGRLIAVVYTLRGTTIRLISARRARTDERERYRAVYPGNTAQ